MTTALARFCRICICFILSASLSRIIWSLTMALTAPGVLMDMSGVGPEELDAAESAGSSSTSSSSSSSATGG